jgi:hypothetical protein
LPLRPARSRRRATFPGSKPHSRPDLAVLPQSQSLAPNPSPARKATLSARFDCIFSHRTGFATLDRLLGRLCANKSELLRVLERPDIPLHTNGSENDIRCRSPNAASAAEPAAMRAATVATPFSRSSRPAPRTASNSGIIWAHASPSPDARIFPTSHKSFARSLLRHHDRQDFCPCYPCCSQAFDISP